MNKNPKSSSAIDQFDLKLCEYVAGNIRQYYDDKTFKNWMQEQVESEDLKEFLMNETKSGEDNTLRILSLNELHELLDCADDMPLGCPFGWTPYVPLHRKYKDCVPELKAAFTETVANEWCRESLEFAGLLESPELKLVEGLEVATDWICALRRYRSPVPTKDSTPEYTEAQRKTVEEAIEELGKDDDGRDFSPKKIRRTVAMNNQIVRLILRDLQGEGKYDGFTREPSIRHRKAD